MKTDRISRIASLFLIFLFLYNDVNASVRALYNWDSLPQVGVNKTKGFSQPAKQVPIEEVLNTPMSKPQAKALENDLVALDALNEFSVETFEESARIGLELHMPINDPRDDIFHFQLPEAFEAQEWSTVYLNYEVKGVADGRSLAKSINSQETFGERNLEADDQWHMVREKLSPADLQAGANYLRFTVPNGLGLSAEVKNISIDFKRAADLEIQSPRLERVVVDDPQYFRAVPSLESTPAYRLREVEMPALPQGIINVTAGAKAYQPSAKVAAQADLIGFKLNIGSLNSQQKLSELQVYYFDYQSSSWQGVAIDSIDGEGDIAFVPNKGQTQYFGALIKSPEMPEASAFAPTMIQDIEAANPASGMNLMQPPSISRKGEASISYPLEIPAGRKGMQPQLALSYNSDGGSSWAGYGWNIAVPSISVDTRWGVPTYDSQSQTESYTYNGNSLFEEETETNLPKKQGRRANRKASLRQSGEVRFFEKLRSSYKDLYRVGSAPDNYFWIEQDAAGNKYYYGTYDGVNLDASGVLRQDMNQSSNIAQWMLCKVVDVWGNYVEYHYTKSEVSTPNVLHEGAQKMVLDYIVYTGHESGNLTPQYKVEFNSTTGRVDASLNSNYGFLVYDDFTLNSINVYYNGTSLKEYKLNFEAPGTNNIHKTLLTDFEEWRSGVFFHEHRFSYYDAELGFEATPRSVLAHNAQEQALFSDLVSRMSSSIEKTLIRNSSEFPIYKGVTGGLYGKASIGTGVLPVGMTRPGKNLTVSGNIGGGMSTSFQRQGFRDMNADGIPDFYEHTGSGDVYYPVVRNEEGNLVKLNTPIDIKEEVMDFSMSTSLDVGFDFVGEIKVPFVLTLNANYGQNWSTAYGYTFRYLTDYNSDGVPDLVYPISGQNYVRFGTLNEFGELNFTPHSNNTLNPIITGAIPEAPSPAESPIDIQTVRSWIAPFAGIVDISGTASMHSAVDGEVKVAIEHNQSFVNSNFQTVNGQNPVSLNYTSISVDEGDTIFFRTLSGSTGIQDFLNWNPQITYLNHSPNKRDGAGLNYSQSKASNGFILSGRQPGVLPTSNSFKISWPSLNISTPFSDDVTFAIVLSLKNDNTGEFEYEWEYAQTLNAGNTGVISESQFVKTESSFPTANFLNAFGSPDDLLTGISTDDFQVIVNFEVRSNSNINWSAIDWRPKFEVDFDECLSGEEGNAIQYPLVDYQSYNRLVEHNAPISLSTSPNTRYRVWPAIGTVNYSNIYQASELNNYLNNGLDRFKSIYLVLKIDGTLIAKMAVRFNADQTYSIHSLNADATINGTISGRYANPTSGVYEFLGSDLNSNEVYLEIYADDPMLAEYWPQLVSSYDLVNLDNSTHSSPSGLDASVYTRNPNLLQDKLLHWGYFGWNDPSLTGHISESDFVLGTSGMVSDANYFDNPAPIDSSDVDQADQNFVSPLELKFIQASAIRGEQTKGLKDYNFLYASDTVQKLDRYAILNSELGFYIRNGFHSPGKFLELEIPAISNETAPTGDDIAYATLRTNKSYTKAHNFGGGASIPFIHGNTTYTNSRMEDGSQYYSQPILNLQDLNGDGYPDIWGGDNALEAMVTDPLGGYKSAVFNYAGGFKGRSITSTNSAAEIGSGGFINLHRSVVNVKDATIGLNLSPFGNSFKTSEITENIFWVDVNGDGLIDKIEESNGVQKVRLNKGYAMTSSNPYSNLSNIYKENRSINLIGGLESIDVSFSKENGSFKGGLNVNRSESFDKVLYIDLTNDNLPDMLNYSSVTGQIAVSVNTGSGFVGYPTVTSSDVALNSSIITGVSASFAAPVATFLIPYTLVEQKFNVNVEVSPNISFNSIQSTLMDMNGDGAPDLVSNTGTNQMQVYYNKIGKSNKLKKVENDLNGSFTIDYRLEGNKVGFHQAVVKTNRETDNHKVFWDMPNGKWVMASLSVDDGLHVIINNKDVDGVDVMQYEYNYDGGYTSRREREFIGFSRLEVVQPKKTYYSEDSNFYENTDFPTGYALGSLDNSLLYQVDRYYTQVMLFKPFTDQTLEGRKRYEYQSQVLEDELFLLNFDVSYSAQNVANPSYSYLIKDSHRILISHKHSTFEYYFVDQKQDLNQTETVPLAWSEFGERSTLFPALIEEETIVRPVVDSSYVFTSISSPNSFFTQGTKYTASYDSYFNVIQYESSSAGANTSRTTVIVDTLNHFYYDWRSFDVSISDLIANTTIEFTSSTPTGIDLDDGFARVVEYTSEPGFLADTLFFEDYWDPTVPDCGGTAFAERPVTVEFKSPMHDMLFIEEDNYNLTYSGNLIAQMDYFQPQTGLNNSDATNVLKEHRVYEGATSNPVSRHSKVSALQSGLGVPTELKQVLSVGQEAEVNITYDIYGNVTQVQGPTDDNSQRATQKYTYDAIVGSYVLEIENPFGEKVYNSYDYRNGNLLRTIGLNGYPVHFVYDDMFRLEEVWGPREYYALMENNANYPTISFIYDLDGYDPSSSNYNEKVPVGVTKHHVNPTAGAYNNLNYNPVSSTAALPNLNGANIPNPLKTATFVDGFGQVVQVRKESSGFDSASSTYKKMREVSGFTCKNKFGWVTSQGWSQLTDPADIPQFRIMNVSTDFQGPGSVQQRIEYDLLGRPSKQIVYDGQEEVTTEMSYFETDGTYDESIGMLGTLTRVGDLNTTTTLNSISVIDARGFQIEQVGFRGTNFTSPEITVFDYNDIGELESTTNDAGMETKYTYDNFGRVVAVLHPDRGTTSLTYDLAGNLLKTVTAETGATGIVNTYNLGRLIQTDYPETGNLNDVSYTYGSKGDGKNGAGRIVKVEQGSGFKTDTYHFDIMGNMTKEVKLISVPQAGDRRFTTEFDYDSWGRILGMVYPDGEELTYSYDATGELNQIKGKLNGQTSQYTILETVLYNGLGQNHRIEYGNGTVTDFGYEQNTRRMSTVSLQSGSATQLLDKTFDYDKRGNIKRVENSAAAVTINGSVLGGDYVIGAGTNGIEYDGMNQVTGVIQQFRNSAMHNITQTMTYNSVGRIHSKSLSDAASTATNYNYTYNYNTSGGKDHQLIEVVNSQGNNFTFTYNAMGSITQKKEVVGSGGSNDIVQDFCWNEHQTLRAVKSGNEDHADNVHYAYDYTGERVLKTLITGGIVNTNSEGQSVLSLDVPTVYVNPYFIASHYDETVLISKHYYMANQRIASALSHQGDTTGFVPGIGYEEGNMSLSTDAIIVDIEASLDCLYGEDVDLDWEQMLAPVSLGEGIMFNACDATEPNISDPQTIMDECACAQSTYWASIGGVDCAAIPTMYFYHPDYLGSVEFVTDMNGDPYQFFFNTIWGENLQNQLAFNTTAFSSRFRFNGKEWDEETGNFNYGARYYDPQISVWLSVDPLAEKYRSLSSYNFVANSPLMLVDPDGRAFGSPIGAFFNKVSNWFKGSGFKTDSQLKLERDPYELDEVIVTAPAAPPAPPASTVPLYAETEKVEDNNLNEAAAVLVVCWGVALVEPTPIGEAVMGIVTAAALGWYGGELLTEMQDQFASEHTKNKRKSTWNKHSKKRSGKQTGQSRNSKRGNKNKKHQKKPNPNLK